MKPNSVHRLLLAAADDSFGSDLLAALREVIAEQSSSSVFELDDFSLLLDLLDRVKSGLFEAVYLAPPAATWSRVRSGNLH